jgi:hypothetical protein
MYLTYDTSLRKKLWHCTKRMTKAKRILRCSLRIGQIPNLAFVLAKAGYG